MGLDMNLYGTSKKLPKSDTMYELTPEMMDAMEIDDLDTYELGYWRKANQIRGWFNEQMKGKLVNCGLHYVPKQKLQELKETCEKVLADESLALELLPPTSGFFFGGDEIDEWYFQDLKDTIEIVDKALKTDNDVVYTEWW